MHLFAGGVLLLALITECGFLLIRKMCMVLLWMLVLLSLPVARSTSMTSRAAEAASCFEMRHKESHPFRVMLEDMRRDYSVPFYLYEPHEMGGMDFSALCAGGFEKIVQSSKHCAAEYIAHEEMKSHRWRTRDPTKAVLFVVPAYLGSSFRGACGDSNSHVARMDSLASALKNSAVFRNNHGHDHLIIAPDYIVNSRTMGEALSEVVENITLAHFESNRGAFKIPWRCTVVVPYDDARQTASSNENDVIDTPMADLQARTAMMERSEKQYNFRSFLKRGLDFVFSGQVDSRQGYNARTAYVNAPATIANRKSVASGYRLTATSRYEPRLPKYPCSKLHPTNGCSKHWSGEEWLNTLNNALFSLMFRGDSATSGRLYDAIFSDTLSIAVSDDLAKFGLPFQCLVPWDNLMLRASEACFEQDPNAVLSRVANVELIELEKVWNDMRKFRKDVLWNVPGSRVVDNLLLTALQTCIDPALHATPVMPCVFPSQHITEMTARKTAGAERQQH